MSSAKGIISRFMHLLSAQGVEGVASWGFFLYLPRIDSTLYGEVMYALAAGSVAMTVIQFGLYYALVPALGSAERDKAPEILNRVFVIKIALFIPSMLVVAVLALYHGFSAHMGLILFLVSLGFGLEALAETFFEEWRVRGLQAREARTRVTSSILSYGYGVLTAALGFNPVLISLFKLISTLVRVGFGIVSYKNDYSVGLFLRPKWPEVGYMFRAASGLCLDRDSRDYLQQDKYFFPGECNRSEGSGPVQRRMDAGRPHFDFGFRPTSRMGGLPAARFPMVEEPRRGRAACQADLSVANGPGLSHNVFPPCGKWNYHRFHLWDGVHRCRVDSAYLVWTILLSFESNLFKYVMMVAGAVNLLLGFAVAATALNFLFNWTLVHQFGLSGACLVIILTKLVMTLLTFFYCRIRFQFLRERDFLFPVALAAVSLGLFLLIKPFVTLHPAVAITLVFYLLILWRLGMRYLGRLPRKSASEAE